MKPKHIAFLKEKLEKDVMSVMADVLPCSRKKAETAIRTLLDQIHRITTADLAAKLCGPIDPKTGRDPSPYLHDFLPRDKIVPIYWLAEKAALVDDVCFIFERIEVEKSCFLVPGSETALRSESARKLRLDHYVFPVYRPKWIFDHYVFPADRSKWVFAWSHENEAYGLMEPVAPTKS